MKNSLKRSLFFLLVCIVFQSNSQGFFPAPQEMPPDTIPVSFAMIPEFHKKGDKLVIPDDVVFYSFNLFGGGYGQLQGLGMGLGFQYATKSVSGAQFSMGFNSVDGIVSGTQATFMVNKATQIHGAQLAFVLNVAEKVKGFQGSLIANQAESVSGVQMGLINIAHEVKGVPLGFFNLIETGSYHTGIWVDESGLNHIGFRSGNKHFYGLLSVFIEGFKTRGQDEIGGFGLGWGWQIPWNKAAVLGDGTIYLAGASGGLFTSKQSQLYRARLAFSYEIHQYFKPFAGISLNISHKNSRGAEGVEPPESVVSVFGDDDRAQFWPGIFFGIEIRNQ